MRAYTQARIALGRAGSSLPTDEVLRFGHAHALARDAVHEALDVEVLREQIRTAGFEAQVVHSAARDRPTYLLRPDLGRRLDDASAAQLRRQAVQGCDLLLVIGDGLSSAAVRRHALPTLEQIRVHARGRWPIGPVVIARQARVALGDEIGHVLGARMVAILIGERPGLSSPDSLGIYLTWAPQPGRSDAERNCISNVRLEGLSYEEAARKLVWLCAEAQRLRLSGVGLKDRSDLLDVHADDET